MDQGQTNESLAGFLHATYAIREQLQLVGGLRYTDDEKDKGGTLDDVGATADTAVGSFQTVGLQAVPHFSWRHKYPIPRSIKPPGKQD